MPYHDSNQRWIAFFRMFPPSADWTLILLVYFLGEEIGVEPSSQRGFIKSMVRRHSLRNFTSPVIAYLWHKSSSF
jgi:hypothetical protein